MLSPTSSYAGVYYETFGSRVGDYDTNEGIRVNICGASWVVDVLCAWLEDAAGGTHEHRLVAPVAC